MDAASLRIQRLAIMVVGILLFWVPSRAQTALRPAPGKPALLLGAAWYPEQWPESRGDTDLALMEAAHIHFVRVGEFAWSRMEPSEGNFQVDWLNRAIRAAEKHHVAVVLGTPSAAPPHGLLRSTLRHCGPRRTAQRTSTEIASSLTGAIQNTAS